MVGTKNMVTNFKNMNDNLIIAILGLGEAGSHFANDLADLGVKIIGFDPNPKRVLHPTIEMKSSNLEAAREATIIFSVNLSSVSEEVAREVFPVLDASKIYLEMNTSSPDKKIAIFEMIKSTCVKYVDLAIMAPVPPKGIKTPFLASGNGAKTFQEKVADLDLDITVLSEEVGEASTRKLLRSIVYKGVAAVICEAMEAGRKYDLESYIREQISSVIGGNDGLIDRFVEGSKTHALRRMHEMEAVVEMLENQGIDPIVSKAARQNLEKLL
jgi:3-hydroxyisobutyrate dehydrogenase-like beta-hydroxyacid dehydrogenase